MYKLKTTIIDKKAKVYRVSLHAFLSKYKMDTYKQNLLTSINDSEVIVTFVTYIKER